MSTNHEPGDRLAKSDPTAAEPATERVNGHQRLEEPQRTAGGAHAAAFDRQTVVRRERERYGGVKIGSAFFGWLTATGTAVILTALLGAIGAAVGLATGTDPQDAAAQAETIGVAGGIALLLVLLVAYFCGGYVAGRMARFNGAKQGVAVWLWALAVAAVVAVAGLIAGNEFDLLARLNGFPRLPVNEGSVTTAGIVAALAAVVVALLGAVLGGLAGMRFHRKVDKVGLGQ